MFFLARSAFCIALVAFMLPASPGPKSWRGLADGARTVASDQWDALCSTHATGCAEATIAGLILADAASTPHPAAAMVRKSVSTLMSADLVPGWRGPAPRS